MKSTLGKDQDAISADSISGNKGYQKIGGRLWDSAGSGHVDRRC